MRVDPGESPAADEALATRAQRAPLAQRARRGASRRLAA
jgi:hypothetical protein